MEAARESMAALLDAGLFDSAQTLGCFLVSSAGASNEAGMSMKVEGLVLHGDALHGEKEFRRALSAYKQAMQYSKSIPRQATSNTRSSVSTTSRNIWFCLGILYDIIPPGVEFGHIIHDFDMDGEEENPSPASEDPPYSL